MQHASWLSGSCPRRNFLHLLLFHRKAKDFKAFLICSGSKMVRQVRELVTFKRHKFAVASDRLRPVSVNSPFRS